MSWDLSVLNVSAGYASVADIPDDAELVPLRRSAIIAGIKEANLSADFSDPSWGIIDGDGWSIELNLGDGEETSTFMLHVRGSDGAVAVVLKMLEVLNLRAIDSQTNDFLTADSAPASFRVWSDYRDRIVSERRPGRRPSRLQRLLSRIWPS